MGKSSKIRWRASDEKEIKRAIKNFNAKLYRIQKQNPEMLNYIPEKIKYSQLKNNIKTRKDLNKQLKYLTSFTQRGAEKLVKTKAGGIATQWDIDRIKEQDRIDNIKRAKRRKEIGEKQVTVKNKPTGVKRKEMGKIKENEVKPRKRKIDNMKQSDFDTAKKLIDRKLRGSYDKERERQLLSNYIKALYNEGVSQDVINIIKRVPIKKLIDKVDLDEIATIDFIYTEENQKLRDKYLKEFWEEHAEQDNITENEIIADAVKEEYELEIGEF